MIPALFLILVVLLLVFFAFLFKWSNVNVINHVSITEKRIALTFDDGPHPEATAQLLDVLQEKAAKATFFLLGEHVEALPEIAARIETEGHEIGNHSYRHPFMLDPRIKPMMAELVHTSKLIEAATGKTPTLFRPPYLLQGPGVKRAVKKLNMQSIGALKSWRLFRFPDWAHQDEPERIAELVLQEARPGAIIVLHDGNARAQTAVSQDYRGGTVTAVAIIIDALQKQGYQFVTVSNLLQQ